jgi:hypothetical protein
MAASTTVHKPRRRRYDNPATLTPEQAAGEISNLTRASLRLTQQLKPSKLARGAPAPSMRSRVQRLVTDIDELRHRLETLLRGGTEALGAPLMAAQTRKPGIRLAAKAAPQDSGILAQMARRGELLDSAAFITRMGCTRQALSKAVLANRLFYVEDRGVRLYPAFFADTHTYQRSQLEHVSKALGTLPGGA